MEEYRKRSRERIARWVRRLFPFSRKSAGKDPAKHASSQVNPMTYTVAEPIKVSTITKPLKVVALCGSLRKASYNRGLIRAAIEVARESIPGMEIELLDISPLPFLNTDLEVDGKFPSVVEDFRNKFYDADCVLFSTPEYNYSVTAVLKNAIDWASRAPNVMAGKPAAIMSVAGSLGGARAQYHLRQIGVYLDLHFVNKPELFVHGTELVFDADGNLIDKDIRDRVRKLLRSLQALAIKLLR